MTFTANVPVTGQSLGNSRPTINSNFTILQSTYDANHVDFNAANAGAHTHVDMLVQASDPNPAVDLVSHYSKDLAGNTEWYFQRENSGPVIQMSTINGTPIVAPSGQTFLPGGLVLKFGTGTFGNNVSTVNLTYGAVGLPDFTTITYSIQATLITFTVLSPIAASTFTINPLTGITFTRPGGLALTNFAWMAIGV